MKKLVLLVLSVFLIASMITPAMAFDEPDHYDEEGTPVYYIDMSPEEWEETFLDHPYFQEYDPQNKAIFRLRDNGHARAICYNCGRSSMSLRQEWRDVENMLRQCPSQTWGSDNRIGFTWVYGDYCTYCGLLGGWAWDQDRYSWSWIMLCHYGAKEYPIYLGKSIDEGYNLHNCYSIEKNDNGIVHGLNCSCH